jgi:hypothetical protein
MALMAPSDFLVAWVAVCMYILLHVAGKPLNRLPTGGGMSLSDLMGVIPAPTAPDNSGTASEFEDIEKRVGIQFPTDFRELAIRYGAGMFGMNQLQFWTPFIVDYADPDLHLAAETLHSEGESKWPAHPVRPGLLQIGGNSNAHTVFVLD